MFHVNVSNIIFNVTFGCECKFWGEKRKEKILMVSKLTEKSILLVQFNKWRHHSCNSDPIEQSEAIKSHQMAEGELVR